MLIKHNREIGITGVTVTFNIYELQRLANLKYELENQSATPETISGLTSAINFLGKIVGDTPTWQDVDKELFGDVEAQLAPDDCKFEVVNYKGGRKFIGTHAECDEFIKTTFGDNEIREIKP